MGRVPKAPAPYVLFRDELLTKDSRLESASYESEVAIAVHEREIVHNRVGSDVPSALPAARIMPFSRLLNVEHHLLRWVRHGRGEELHVFAELGVLDRVSCGPAVFEHLRWARIAGVAQNQLLKPLANRLAP